MPFRGSRTDINLNATWLQNGLTLTIGNGYGNGINQLYNPYGLYVRRDQTVDVSDRGNHCIMEFQPDVKNGHLVASGNKQGHEANQFSS